MNRTRLSSLDIFALAAALSVAISTHSRVAVAEDFSTPEAAAEKRPDFLIQGEYKGEVPTDAGPTEYGLQVVAHKDGYRFLAWPGGFPGAGWSGDDPIEGTGENRDDGTVALTPSGDHEGTAVIDARGEAAEIFGPDGAKVGRLEKVVRKSPTLGAKAPEGALVLFDGSDLDEFPGAKMTEDGLLIPRADTERKLGSGKLHVEFRTPYQPDQNIGGQGRGNSGVYLQSRYEVQVLDSFGVRKPGEGHCGGIYSISPPKLNACFPPLTWQTYDIEFKASTKNDAGEVVPGRMTVRLNGILIHEDVKLVKDTTAAPVRNIETDPRPLHLQWHGNPVRFRNIWFVPAEE